MKKKTLIAVLAVILAVVLTGCTNWVQAFYSKSHLMRIAKEALHEKYGGEYEVRRIYSDHWSQFYATVATVDEEEIIFTAAILKSGKIYKDDYLENILGKQAKDILYPKMNAMWPDAYVKCKVIFNRNYKDEIGNNYKSVTLKQLIETEGTKGNLLVDLFIPQSEEKRHSIEEEYDFWANDIGDMIKEGIVPGISLGAWIVEDNQMSEVEDFYETTEDKITFIKNKFGDTSFHFGYDDETLTIMSTFEEYRGQRDK